MTKFGLFAERIEVAVLMMWNSNLAAILQKVMKKKVFFDSTKCL